MGSKLPKAIHMEMELLLKENTRNLLNRADSHVLYLTPDSIRKNNPELNKLNQKDFAFVYSKFLGAVGTAPGVTPLPNSKDKLLDKVYYVKNGDNMMLVSIGDRNNYKPIAEKLSAAVKSFTRVDKKTGNTDIEQILAKYNTSVESAFYKPSESKQEKGFSDLSTSGVDVGHIGAAHARSGNRGRGTQGASSSSGYTFGLLHEVADANKLKEAKILINRAYERLGTIHTPFTTDLNKEFKTNLANLGISYVLTIPQHWTLNQKRLGTLEGKIVRNLAWSLKRLADKPGSRSFNQHIDYVIKEAAYGRKARNSTLRKKSKGSITNKIKIPKTGKIPKIPIKKGKRKSRVVRDFDVIGIQSLINASLAIKVKDELGDAGDPPIRLRNQTGRFAESAKLLTLTRAHAGILLGTYTYQRNPYDTFLPGGRLGTKQRDPRLYIEGAIREIAIQLLRNKFPGIALELK